MDKYQVEHLLSSNITKTMGCTDIGVVGYIASIGAYILRNKVIKSVKLLMSEELYKNSVNVGIPGLKESGLEKALALGILLKDPKKQLSVFESVTNDDVERIGSILDAIDVNIEYRKFDHTVLYEELHLTSTEGDEVTIIIQDSYDNVTSVIRNQEVLEEFEKEKLLERINKYDIGSFDEILEFVEVGDFEGLDYLFETSVIQYENARNEIKKASGNFLVEHLREAQKDCVYDLSNFLRKHISVPASKRMAGEIYTVYGVAGSGNLGIGTLITPMFLADALKLDEITKQKIVMLSFLTSVYVKQEMNIVTVLCGTGHATGCSAAAVTAYVKKGSNDQIKQAINLYLSTSMGFICDGAKMSCTNKVSFAAMNGMISGKMSIDDSAYCDGMGLNKIDIDKTIKNLGKLNNEILNSANRGIIELI